MTSTTVALDMACGGSATAIVSALLNPTDVIKTRRQIGGLTSASPLAMARSVAATEGVWKGLWAPGLAATVYRELLYSGCTKGLSRGRAGLKEDGSRRRRGRDDADVSRRRVAATPRPRRRG